MSATAMRARAANLRITTFRAGVVQRARTFQTSAWRSAVKETAEGNDARKAEVEREKHQQLKEQKEGKGEWKQALASESESILKADRGEMKASKETIKELQEESAKAAQAERK